VAWALTAARSYAVPGFFDLLSTFGQPVQNADETLAMATVKPRQRLVVWGGRSVVAIAVIVALIGVWRSWRNRTLQLTAVILMVLPGILLVITGFDGEVLLRVMLFAAPFIAFNAATAAIPQPGAQLRGGQLAAIAVCTALFLPGFLLGYYGKERQNYFTPGEVQAAAWVSEHAKPGSLLVEGSRNYPSQFRNYENFTYVAIDREPQTSWGGLLADPADVLSDWLAIACR
jgi:hypothetical protein